MNGFLTVKDIKFPNSKASILLRGGIISRSDLTNFHEDKILLKNTPYGIAKRVLDVTSIEVATDKEFILVMCGDEDTLKKMYTEEKKPNEKTPIADFVNKLVEEGRAPAIIATERVETSEYAPAVDEAISPMITINDSTEGENGETKIEEISEESGEEGENATEEATSEETPATTQTSTSNWNNTQKKKVNMKYGKHRR